jgi:hypothetical protein
LQECQLFHSDEPFEGQHPPDVSFIPYIKITNPSIGFFVSMAKIVPIKMKEYKISYKCYSVCFLALPAFRDSAKNDAKNVTHAARQQR